MVDSFFDWVDYHETNFAAKIFKIVYKGINGFILWKVLSINIAFIID